MIISNKYIVLIFILAFCFIHVEAVEHRGLKNEILYYIVVDRFFDGNKDNNIPKWAFPFPLKISEKKWNSLKRKGKLENFKKDYLKAYKKSEWNRAYLEKMYDKTGKKFQHYQGGDLEGIIKKLDYLEDLGITAIMISPIFENINGIFYGRGNTAYHGYWTKDWFRLEEHYVNPPLVDESLEQVLRGEEIVKRLVKLAHAKGIKILLDLSFNHASPITEDDWIESPAVYKDGVLVKKYCNPNEYKNCEETILTSDFFNPRRAIKDWKDDFELQNYQMHSLVDINQNNEQAKKYLISSAIHWLSFGIDGYRVDAIKHIFPKFLKELEKSLIKVKSDVILIGEYFDGGDHNSKSIEWVESTERYSMFDFSFASFMRDFFTGITDYHKRNTPEFLKEIFENGSSVSSDFITFINNHDIPRMLTLKNVRDKQYIAALKFMMVSRGVPKLTYGDEIAHALNYEDIPVDDMGDNLISVGADPWCRNPMTFSWYKSGEKRKDIKKNYYFKMTKKLINFRKQMPVLRYGKTKLLRSIYRGRTQWFGYNELAMMRFGSSYDEKIYFFYSRVKQKISYKVDLPSGEYQDLIDESKIFTVKNGIITLDMQEDDAIIIK